MDTERTKSLAEDLTKATLSLEEAINLEPTEINIDGTIQRFEYTFELSWKLVHAVAAYQGKEEEARNPRNAFRYGAYVGLIENAEAWFVFLDARNATVHLYDKTASREAYDQIKGFPILVRQLIKEVESIVAS